MILKNDVEINSNLIGQSKMQEWFRLLYTHLFAMCTPALGKAAAVNCHILKVSSA